MHVHKCYHTVFGKSHAIHLAIVVVSSNRTRWRWKTSSFESTRNKAVGALLVFKLARPKQEKVQYVLDYRLASKLKAEKNWLAQNSRLVDDFALCDPISGIYACVHICILTIYLPYPPKGSPEWSPTYINKSINPRVLASSRCLY